MSMKVIADGKEFIIPERNASLIRGQLNANCESCETIKQPKPEVKHADRKNKIKKPPKEDKKHKDTKSKTKK